MLTEPAPAKINLTLHVTGRRADGYHLLDSLVAFAGAQDLLRAEEAHELILTLSGPFGAGLAADPDNLVLRAARALAAFLGRPPAVRLHLEKSLPIASGIGGGSADAAATLRLLCRLWHAWPPPAALLSIAAGLGADVPVCLASRPRHMEGIGEILSELPDLPKCGILLVNPGVAVPTQAVFRARIGPYSAAPAPPAAWPTAASLAAHLITQRNDLQPAAISLCPPVGEVLNRLTDLPGALLARMSGSGATCFALFATPAEARQASAALQEPGWWCWGGPLYAAAPAT